MTTSLTATVHPAYGRVLLNLTWTTVTSATISRIHADGSVWPLRTANPTVVLSTTGVGAVVFDHEAPLDQAVTYLATSTQSGVTFSSSPVTVASDPTWLNSTIWLTHPLRPALSMLLAVTDITAQTRSGRTGLLQIIGSNVAVAVTDRRIITNASMSAFTTTSADTVALRALLDDGSVLLMRPPGSWGTPWQYIAVGDATEVNATTVGPVADREWVLPYAVVAGPAGAGQGAIGSTWNDTTTAYATWTTTIAGEATWNALITKAGP